MGWIRLVGWIQGQTGLPPCLSNKPFMRGLRTLVLPRPEDSPCHSATLAVLREPVPACTSQRSFPGNLSPCVLLYSLMWAGGSPVKTADSPTVCHVSCHLWAYVLGGCENHTHQIILLSRCACHISLSRCSVGAEMAFGQVGSSSLPLADSQRAPGQCSHCEAVSISVLLSTREEKYS